MKKIGVVLGGCGVYDGSEIHEAVITLLAIARNGAQAVCFAPDKPQRDVINHLTGEPLTEQRNVLVEAARIARGDILPLTQARAETLDALIVPGGFGAAKNLSSFAAEGSKCEVDHDLRALALAMHQTGKPLGFMCIAPAMLPKIFAFPLRITIGTDLDTADANRASRRNAADVGKRRGQRVADVAVHRVVFGARDDACREAQVRAAEKVVRHAAGDDRTGAVQAFQRAGGRVAARVAHGAAQVEQVDEILAALAGPRIQEGITGIPVQVAAGQVERTVQRQRHRCVVVVEKLTLEIEAVVNTHRLADVVYRCAYLCQVVGRNCIGNGLIQRFMLHPDGFA